MNSPSDPDPVVQKRTFAHTENGHYKFYEVEITTEKRGKKSVFIVDYRWGRIGNQAQAARQIYTDPWTAEQAAQKKIKEKLAKGYKETTDNPHYDTSWLTKEYVETPESKEKLDMFLSLLK